jgi:hypothetical protein
LRQLADAFEIAFALVDETRPLLEVGRQALQPSS